MADLVSQLLPVGAALTGVALTFAGNAWLEHQKWRRARSGEQQARTLQAFTELLQSTTDIARTLRQTAERVVAEVELDLGAVADHVDELIGQARRHGTIARLVGPSSAYSLIAEIDSVLAPIHQLIKDIATPDDGKTLVEPARKLMKLRDGMVEHLRDGGHVV